MRTIDSGGQTRNAPRCWSIESAAPPNHLNHPIPHSRPADHCNRVWGRSGISGLDAVRSGYCRPVPVIAAELMSCVEPPACFDGENLIEVGLTPK